MSQPQKVIFERRHMMAPPPDITIPPAVVQLVVEYRVLLAEIRTHYGLERRGKDIPHERDGEPG